MSVIAAICSTFLKLLLHEGVIDFVVLLTERAHATLAAPAAAVAGVVDFWEQTNRRITGRRRTKFPVRRISRSLPSCLCLAEQGSIYPSKTQCGNGGGRKLREDKAGSVGGANASERIAGGTRQGHGRIRE